MTYYVKQGRRYKAVAEYDDGLMSSLPEGSHLIMVTPGCRSTVCNIPRSNLTVRAVLEAHKNELCKVILKASEMRPREQPITKRQAAAWEEMRKAFGASMATMHVDSASDIIDALHKAIEKEVCS